MFRFLGTVLILGGIFFGGWLGLWGLTNVFHNPFSPYGRSAVARALAVRCAGEVRVDVGVVVGVRRRRPGGR